MILQFSDWLNEKEDMNESRVNLKLDLPKDILDIHKQFMKRGYSLYVVGGAVRDAILGKRPKDFDLATEVSPKEIIKIANKNKWSVVTVGEAFGVVIVNGHEIATFREDIGVGRRPDSVKFSTIDKDVKRRDLTINALFYDITKGEIVDLVGGERDLKNKTVRTVGDPKQRFMEDPLRKLRALRFHGLLGGNMDAGTLTALKEDPDISKVSTERIRDEFTKSIEKTKSVKTYLELCYELGFLEQIFSGLEISTDFIEEKDIKLLFAWLLRTNDIKTVEKILNKLNWTKKEVYDISVLLKLIDFSEEDVVQLKKLQNQSTLDDKTIKRWGTIVGTDFDKFIKFRLTVRGSDAPKELKFQEIGKWVDDKEYQNYKSLQK